MQATVRKIEDVQTMIGREIFVALLLLLSGIVVPTSGQEVFTDFEGASLKAWSVDDDVIRLVGQSTWTAEPNGYRWVNFLVGGIHGMQPEFQIGSLDNRFFGDLTGHRFVWSYDQEHWSFFDNNSGTSSDFRFGNDAPFIQEEVYVAYSTPYPVARTQSHLSGLVSQWFVSPTASATTDLIIGHQGELPIYGFRITNPLFTESKKKIVLVGGNHSGEMSGTFALEGLVDFLTSDDARARQMRNVAEFFVYPQVDPLGRNEGYYRGNSQNPANDHNRFWDAGRTHDNGGFPEIDLVANAMRLDTGQDVDFTFDFHGFFDSGPNFIYSDSVGMRSVFTEALQVLEPALQLEIDDSQEPAGILEFWAKTPAGLNSDYAFTPEFSPNLSSDETLAIGKNFGLALFAELGSPTFFRSPSEIDTLTQQLNSGSNDVAFDLNRDGVVDALDRLFLLVEVLSTIPGDTDLNGSVDFPDFLALTDSFSRAGGWGDGDFDGNSRVEFSDFLQLSQNFGVAATTVPEPLNSPIMWLALAFLHTGRSRRRVNLIRSVTCCFAMGTPQAHPQSPRPPGIGR